MMKNITPVGLNKAERTKRSEELEKLIRHVALDYNKNGSLSVLAEHCKVSYHGLRTSIRRGYFTPFMACALEIGTEQKLKKEELAPHIYK